MQTKWFCDYHDIKKTKLLRCFIHHFIITKSSSSSIHKVKFLQEYHIPSFTRVQYEFLLIKTHIAQPIHLFYF